MKNRPADQSAHIQALFNHVWGAAPNPAAEYDRYVRERDAIADREESLRADRKDRTRERFRNAGPGPCVELSVQGDAYDVVARCFSAILNEQSDEVLQILTGELDEAIDMVTDHQIAREDLPEGPPPVGPQFIVGIDIFTLAEMIAANEADPNVVDWLTQAEIGQRCPGLEHCRRVA